MYIITKLNVKDLCVENVGTFDTKEVALTKLFGALNDETNIEYENKINNKKHILVYKIYNGYIKRYKELSYIYQIIEILKDETDEDDDLKQPL